MLGIWKPHAKRGKIRLSTVMMTSGKKRTLSCCFHPNDVEGWKFIEYPLHKIIAHHQPGREIGGGGGVELGDWAKIKAEMSSLDPKLTPKNSRAEFPSPKILTMD